MYRGRLSFLRSLILFPFLFLNPGSVSDPDGAPLWQFNDCSLFNPIRYSSNFLPATEINMFGHASQMRKPRFCELVWTPAASQPTWGEWKLDFATKNRGRQLLSLGRPRNLPASLLPSSSAQPYPLFLLLLLCVNSAMHEIQ